MKLTLHGSLIRALNDRRKVRYFEKLTMIKRQTKTIAVCFLLLYVCRNSAKGKKKVDDDVSDTLEEGTYEQENEAEMFYDDAVRYALDLLWKHRYHISMANFQLIHILGRNASETIKFRKELHAMRDTIDEKSEELKSRLKKNLTLKDMIEPIEKPILENLTHTWKNVKGVFDVNQPVNRTYEFTQLYKWMGNIDNETFPAYKKVDWLMARIRRMRPVKL